MNKYGQWAQLAQQNGWDDQQLANAFVQQAKQQGMSRNEAFDEYTKVLKAYDDLRTSQQPDQNNLVQKGVDLAKNLSGPATKLGGVIGDSVAATVTNSNDIIGDLGRNNPVTAPVNAVLNRYGGEGYQNLKQQANDVIRQQLGIASPEQLQQQQDAQRQNIMNRVVAARQAGNEQEAQRLLSILQNNNEQNNALYNQQIRDYNRGIQDTLQGAVGTGAEIAGMAIPGAKTITGAALEAGLEGAIQGAALSDADIINDQNYGQMLQEAAIGGATGAILGGTLKAAEIGAGKLKSKIASKTGKAKAQDALSEITYDGLDRKQKKQLQREVKDFMNDNDLSVPRQRGKVLKPEETVFEIDRHLNDLGSSVKRMNADEIEDFTQLVTGPEGATSKTTRDMLASLDRPINITTREGEKRVDTIIRGVQDAIENTSEIYGDDVAERKINNKVAQLLDRAKVDLNHYDPAKLYDVQRDFEKIAAQYRAADARSIGGNLVAKETANIYQTAANEIANKLDNAAVATGVFEQGRDALAQQYRDMGMNRLADQVTRTKNISQLRSTAAPFVKMSQIIEEGKDSAFSTMNRNTTQVNKILNRMRGIPGMIADTADFLTGGKTSRGIGYAMEDVNDSLRDSVNKWITGREGWTQAAKKATKGAAKRSGSLKQLTKAAVPVVAGQVSKNSQKKN